MKECSFCSEFTYEVPNNSLFEKIKTEDFNSRVIWQNEHFILTPTIGCFIEGYVLLVTKRHISTFGALNEMELQSFISVYQKISEEIRKEYGGCVTFEHGSVELCHIGGGACEDHAHIHFLPKNIDFKPDIEHSFSPSLLNSFADLREYESNGTPYLLFSTPEMEHYICDAYNIQSQYLRIITTMKEGISEFWNWREHPFPEKMKNTYNKLRENHELNNLK